MTIDVDVATAARQWGLNAALLQAVVTAEGGGDHIIRAVQCSLPSVTTREKALEVLCRSCVHAMRDYIDAGEAQRAFVQFWAARWAPRGAANDPTDLNANWARNVLALWGAHPPEVSS